MSTTDKYGWTMPTVGGSGGTWGTELNDLIDKEIEEQVKSNENTAAAALPKAGGVLTGEVEIKTERYASMDKGSMSGSTTFDLSAANFQFGTLGGDISVTFSNWPASGKAEFVTIEITNGGAHSISWPGAVEWDGGSAPALQSSGVDTLVFYSRDGGTTIRGMHSYSRNA